MMADDGAELETMFSRVSDLGVATSLDMTLPDPDGPAGAVDWRRLLARVLPHVDIFTPSLEELLYMLAPDQWAALIERADGGDVVELVDETAFADLAEEAIGLGARIVLLKCGHRGGYLRTGNVGDLADSALPLSPTDWSDVALPLEALPVDADRFVNACGAGDAAVAGLLTGLLRGETPADAGHLAMCAGRDSLYGVDTTSGLTEPA
jgi:sugar/nucleoside kinase (ribokinase family)